MASDTVSGSWPDPKSISRTGRKTYLGVRLEGPTLENRNHQRAWQLHQDSLLGIQFHSCLYCTLIPCTVHRYLVLSIHTLYWALIPCTELSYLVQCTYTMYCALIPCTERAYRVLCTNKCLALYCTIIYLCTVRTLLSLALHSHLVLYIHTVLSTVHSILRPAPIRCPVHGRVWYSFQFHLFFYCTCTLYSCDLLVLYEAFCTL